MATPRQTEAVSRETIAYYNAAKGNKTEAAALANQPRDTFVSRFKKARLAFPELIGEFAVARGGAPKAPEAAPQTLDDKITEHRALKDAQVSKAHLKDAMGQIAKLQDQIKDYEWASKASAKPAEWTLKTPVKKQQEHTPYLLFSDAQIGEVVRAEETEAGYGYDAGTFCERYRRMIDATISLSMHHSGENWKFPGIIYSRGGDTISGAIHDELAQTDSLTPFEAVELAFSEEAAGIAKLADAFGRVDVKAPGAAGNHDRNTHKPQAKKAFAHSYDRMVMVMLMNNFRYDKRVTFQTSQSFDVVFPIYNKTILVTHGDRIGSRGGQGFIGPAATILRGAQRVVAEQAALGRHIDRVDVGHFHTFFYYDWVLANGSFPGFSEYAKANRLRPQPPIQTLLFHHPERGCVDIKPINLLG